MTEESDEAAKEPTTIDLVDVLQFGSGIDESDRSTVTERLRSLEARLNSFDEENLELEIWVRQRATTDQKVFLTVKAGPVDLIASSQLPDMLAAVSEVNKDMRRQLDDWHSRQQDRRGS